MRTEPQMTVEDVEVALLELPTFAERLDWLLTHVVRPDHRPEEPSTKRSNPRHYTNSDLARAIGLTEPYVSKLRSGTSQNPGIDVVAALADFFQLAPGLLVPPLGAGKSLADQERVRERLRVAARINRLSPDAAAALERILDEHAAHDHDGSSGRPDPLPS